jgi:hypothetical protein
MADAKISALTGATTPLAGTEEVPVVQGGATRKVSIANLTTGRALSATELTLTTGNLIVSNGKGIDFSATPGAGTSELLSDYEEGTWTPILNTDGTNFTSVTYNASTTGTYVKIGSAVYVWFFLRIDAVDVGAASGNVRLANLPFVPTSPAAGISVSYSDGWATLQPVPTDGAVQSGGIVLTYRATSSCGTVNLAVASVGVSGNNFLIGNAFYKV